MRATVERRAPSVICFANATSPVNGGGGEHYDQ
jgi:hypothetical protein